MKYVIKEMPTSRYEKSEGYYTGESFIVQGCTYYVFLYHIECSKKYSSRKRAENAIKSIHRWNITYNLVIEETEE